MSERSLARGFVMNKLVLSLVALASLAGAGVARADQAVGTVERIDPATRTIWVAGNPYHLEDDATPLAFADIVVGQKVRLEFDGGRGATRDVYQATLAE